MSDHCLTKPLTRTKEGYVLYSVGGRSAAFINDQRRLKLIGKSVGPIVPLAPRLWQAGGLLIGGCAKNITASDSGVLI